MKKDRAKRILVASILSRREVLSFLGGTAAVSILGCLRGQSASGDLGSSTQTPTQTAIATTPSCVVKPQQTEDPYFQDGIFQGGGEQLMLLVTKDAQGYRGTFDIGLPII